MQSFRSDGTPLLKILAKHGPVLSAAGKLHDDHASVRVKTLHGSSRALFIAALLRLGDLPFVVVTPNDKTADDLAHDLRMLIGPDAISVMRRGSTSKTLSDTTALQHDHVDAVTRMARGTVRVVVCSAPCLALPLPPSTEVTSATIAIEKGASLAFDDMVVSLAVNGYERTDYVSAPGDLAVRGGIIDVFPGGWDNPVRIEFWGNDVESIREFEPMSQRSIRELDRCEFLGRVYHTDDSNLSSRFVDHIRAESVVAIIEPESVLAELDTAGILDDYDMLVRYRSLLINGLGETDVDLRTQPQPSFNASVEMMVRYAQGQLDRGYTVFVAADGTNNAKRIRELCENMAEMAEHDDEVRGAGYHRAIDGIQWSSVALSDGIIWDDAHLVVITEHQTFGRQRAQHRSRKRDGGVSMRDIYQLHKGEYVVHEDKGVGQFDGLETITIGGSQQECVKLLFSGGDVLYVHLNYVHKLSKFAAEEGSLPTLSKLGSAEWERKKAKAKKRIKDIARDLIQLYAKRKSQPGFAYPADTIWQKEFEASFQYEDTVDQARSTAEVKADMEQPTPMDRLVCGDVGFGKTEIAIRAAFKAAQAGRQVAVLVPTTVLAQQHYVTFRDRLSRYPVKIDVLSRFKTKTEQKDIVEGLKQGTVDIIVGTHRLLSKDVAFKNLGLLIIDEEHRFGVSAKERLRSLRANIDTLTLTATPIPRTLNFSLMGARDLSVIETPPRNRLPIETEILQWDDDILRDALLRELDRGGQAFLVTDRIGDMDKIRMRLSMLIPSLRIAQAHGQMESDTLEEVMEGFLERRFDLLIATKIIESGLDIPNANTMIIVNADNFGLAELYQLRGRVGRSNVQAYCYLVIPPAHTLSRQSLRRLQALEEFTDLGSGFQLAMRDLEIRGAGNLLGGEQSGFIMDMGFELYHKILDEAVEELRNEEFNELFGSKHKRRSFENEDVAIELDVDALLPKSYIPADTDRYETYKKLYNAHEQSAIDIVFAELRDRFGSLPPEAEALLYAVRMRIAVLPTGVVRVNLKDTRLVLELPPETHTTYYEEAFPRILPYTASERNVRFVQQGKRLLLSIDLDKRDDVLPTLEHLAALVTAEDQAQGVSP